VAAARSLARCGLDWIRLLYCYPTKVDEALIEAMAEVPQVLHYLDMPLQHAAPEILKAMNRGGRQEGYLRLIGRLRAAMPDICLRSTFIVGFPGEHRGEVEQLGEFLDLAQLDRVGFFAYSPEPGTPAAELPGQVPHKVALARSRCWQPGRRRSRRASGGLLGGGWRVLVERRRRLVNRPLVPRRARD